ncbi:unnamed protein product [Orchesella dallaii]|uniref:Peptidase S1 domain-containing protein n=1 Tax=Orchesella dallaii TaxID=48710 RepID=A0ABP1RVV4_9HEXA
MSNLTFTLILSSIALLKGNQAQSPLLAEKDDSRLKIIGGFSACDGDIPYQILVKSRGRSTCGGSFIIVNGTHFVLTAAHCVNYPNNPSRYTVIAGEVDRRTTSGNEQIRNVTKVIRHNRFSRFTYANDIALLAIDEPFTINSYVAPIALPKQGQTTHGDVVASGWGKTAVFRRTLSPVLKQAYLSIIDDNACRIMYVYPTIKFIFSSMLCAGRVVGGSGSCNGDSGGPLRAVDGNYLAAIVSWGTICAFPLQPGVFTEVSHFVDWIEEQASNV